MTPRPYQIAALDAIWQALQVKPCVLLEAACSAGKTMMFSKIIWKTLQVFPEGRALVLMDREILVRQTVEKLRIVAPELSQDIGIMCASVSHETNSDKRITVASRQTLANRMDNFLPVQLVVIDEVHLVAHKRENEEPKDQFNQILEKLFSMNPGMRFLGVTATPYRLNGGYIYGEDHAVNCIPWFDTVDYRITVKQLEADGYLAPLTGYTAVAPGLPEEIDDRVGKVAGEYNLGQLGEFMTRPVHIQSAVDAWKKHASDRKKTIAFCVTIAHCDALADAFNNAGIPAISIHSGLTDIENSLAMQALSDGQFKVFCSVAKLTTGMDVPDIDCILMCRPTESAALYKQILGRGQRIADGKTDCLVVDMVGNNAKFGTDLDDLKVRYVGQGKSQKKRGVKECPSCSAEIHPACRICPECEYRYPATEYVDNGNPEMQAVGYGQSVEPDIRTFDVTGLDIMGWESKKSGKDLLRVVISYNRGLWDEKASLWLCFPDDGYGEFPSNEGARKWEMLADETQPIPTSASGAYDRRHEIRQPDYVVVDVGKKWPEITDFGWNDEDRIMEIDGHKYESKIDIEDIDDIPF